MKFILNEKYILSEGFILTEAIAKDDLTNILSRLTSTVADAKEAITNTKNSELQTIIDCRKKIDKLGTDPTYEELKNAINEYITKLKVFGKAANSNTLRGKINDIEKFIKDPKNKALPELEGKKKLKSLFKDLDKLVDVAILSNNTKLDPKEVNKLNTQIEAITEAINKLKATLDEANFTAIQQLPNAEDTLQEIQVKLIDTQESFTANLIKTNLNSIDAFNQNKNSIFEACGQTLNTLQDIDSVFSGDKGLIKQAADEAQRKKDSATIDARNERTKAAMNTSGDQTWTQRYKNLDVRDTEALKQFWDDYYSQYWANNQDVQKLGAAFDQELKAFGFDATENPFIQYLQKILPSISITKEKYDVIHNAYVKRYLDNFDLIGKQDGTHVALQNIIFSKNFYSQSTADMLEYLRIQNYVLRTLDLNGIQPETIKNYYNGSKMNYHLDLFYKDGDTTKANETFKGNVSNDLKSLKQIKTEQEATGTGAPKKAEKSEFKIDALTDLNENTYDRYAKYLLTKYKDDSIIALMNKYNVKDTQLSANDTELLGKRFDNINIDEKNAEKILKAMAVKVGRIKEAT